MALFCSVLSNISGKLLLKEEKKIAYQVPVWSHGNGASGGPRAELRGFGFLQTLLGTGAR